MFKKNNLIVMALTITTLSINMGCIASTNTWSAPEPLLNQSIQFPTSGNISCCYDSINDRVMAVWPALIGTPEGPLVTPLFAVFQTNTWVDQFISQENEPIGPIAPIVFDLNGQFNVSTDSGPDGFHSSEVALCFNSTQNNFFAVWATNLFEASGNGLSIATYYYNEGSATWTWSTVQTVNFEETSPYSPSCCYDSTHDQVFVTWFDGNEWDPYSWTVPYNSITGQYDLTNTPSNIAPGLQTNGVPSWISRNCYDAAHDKVFTTFQNYLGYPNIVIYDGLSQTWSDTVIIGDGVLHTSNPFHSMNLCYNSRDETVIATYLATIDLSNTETFYAASVIWTATNEWADEVIITNTFEIDSSSYGFEARSCYDSIQNQIITSWASTTTEEFRNNTQGYPIYSILNNNTWSNPAPISTAASTINSNVSTCFDSTNNRIFSFWTDADTEFIWYSIYQLGPVASGSLASGGPITISNIKRSGSTTLQLNSTAPYGNPLIFSIMEGPKHGGLSNIIQPKNYTDNQTATIRYIPYRNAANFDTFIFQSYDPITELTSDPATINLEISNNIPEALPQVVNPIITSSSGATSIKLSGIDALCTGLTFYVNAPLYGTLSEVSQPQGSGAIQTASVSYTPSLESNIDSFEFYVSNGTSLSTTTTVYITVS